MNEITKKILEALEIKPDEEFEVKYKDGLIREYKFNTGKNVFQFYSDMRDIWFDSDYNCLFEELMNGKAQIIRKPWKPKQGEKYYNIAANGWIDNNYWFGGAIDLGLWHMGNCFQSKEQAEANKDRMLKSFNGDKPLWKRIEEKID